VSSDHSVPGARERTAPPVPLRSAVRSVRLAAAVIWTVLILVLCWLPAEIVHEVEGESPWLRIPNLDKVVHCGIFVVLSILWLRLRQAPTISHAAPEAPGSSPVHSAPRTPHPAPRAASRPTIWMVILGGFALGALSELGQTLPIVGRDASLYDLVTDCVGVLIGVAITPLVEPLIRFVERRLFREPVTELIPPTPAAQSR
jgi:hypothetical protein